MEFASRAKAYGQPAPLMPGFRNTNRQRGTTDKNFKQINLVALTPVTPPSGKVEGEMDVEHRNHALEKEKTVAPSGEHIPRILNRSNHNAVEVSSVAGGCQRPTGWNGAMTSWTMEGVLIFTGLLAFGLLAERPRKINVAESIADQWLEQARLMSACLNQISGDISAIRNLMEERIYEHGLRDESRRPAERTGVTRISASGPTGGFDGLDAELREWLRTS
jgi:hypothetical protein